MTKSNNDKVINFLSSQASYAEGALERFAADLKVNPLHAFEFGGAAIEAAARHATATRMLAQYEYEISDEGGGVEAFLNELRREVMRSARAADSNSTSAIANAARAAELAAQATLFEQVERLARAMAD